MKIRRRRSARGSRPDWRSLHERRAALAGQSWFRGSRRRVRREVDTGQRSRRLLAVVGAAGEVALLGLLLFGPLLPVRGVEVRGNHRLAAAEVVAAAGLQAPGSIFALDPGAAERRLESSPWIRTASVSTRLPAGVTIRIEEWQPVAVYQPGTGSSWYLSDQAVALGPVASGAHPDGLLDVKGPRGRAPSPGQQVLDERLLVALVNIQRALPDILGQDVRSFQVDSCGNLTMIAGRGWKAQFGRVLTPEEFASLKDKVAALKAVSARVNFDSPDLDYVNVMNPTQVAVMTRSAERALAQAPKPSPTRSPKATSSSAPTGPIVITPAPGASISTVQSCP